MSDSKLLLSLFFILFAYSSSYSSNNTRTCSLQQSHALLLFKQNVFSNNNSYDESVSSESIYHDYLGSDYYPIMMNWKTSIDCCNWEGVTCNRFTGDVIALDLSCGMLRGTIHSNTTLFDLPRLQRLNVAFNDLKNSQLSREIGRFSNSLTHLNISFSGFRGQVPMDITLLRKLVSLDLSSNYNLRVKPHVLNHLLQNSTILRELSLFNVNVSSPLPIYFNISSSLRSLSLRSTGLQIKLPDNIFNLPHLEELDLAYVRFTDRLPKVNTSMNIPLKLLELSFTGLSGEIPYSIGHLKSLNFLGLRNTNLSGEIPDSIGHLKSLNHLDLSYTNLSGELPDSIRYLKSLNVLRLESCGLMGPLPKSLFNLRNLTRLFLTGNMFNGTLPSSLFTLPLLEHIFLNGNMFSGSLPLELFNRQSLKTLNLGGNQFVGDIDMLDQGSSVQAFWKLTNLNSLDLSFNNFSGIWELDTLLSITSLHLSYSGLSVVTNNDTHYVNPNFSSLGLASCKLKVFPKSLRAMKNLWYLDFSNNEIHGNIPDWAAEIGGNQLYFLNLSHNFITSLPKFQWDGLQYLC